jgi:sec-independent protein translocase protein TatA
MRFGSLGPQEILIILGVIILLFGTSRVATIGGALGKSIRDFRDSFKEEKEDA